MDTLEDAKKKYESIKTQFKNKVALKPNQQGGLVFAGKYWPMRGGKIETIKEHDVQYAFKEARKIAMAYIACKAAISGSNEAHKKRMIRWFGERGNNQPDWWTGVSYILGAIETHIVKNIKVYYRGDTNLIGKPNDYPGENRAIVERDIEGYAESDSLVKDNIIGLCKDFFAKKKNGSIEIKLEGRDCVGGVLLHELSHNICGTEDHANSKRDCVGLATRTPYLAWYNADNIEYFCEDVIYNM